jgi:hypothetical protein
MVRSFFHNSFPRSDAGAGRWKYSSQHTADTDDDQVARKMLAIDRAARVFESPKSVEHRNDVLVRNNLHDRTLHN